MAASQGIIMAKYDINLVKSAAAGRWREIIASHTSLDPQLLDCNHHPCPKCGGNDRFRALSDFDQSGGMICNQCFNRKNGDGLAAISWLTGKDFGAVLDLVAKHCNVKPEGKSAVDPAKDLKFLPWSSVLVNKWCLRKGGITHEGVKRAGGRLARYRDEFTVIAIPVWGPQLTQAEPVGWALYNATGEYLPRQRKDKSIEWLKVKTTHGSEPGVFGNVQEWMSDEFTDSRTWWKTEGSSDMLALLSLPGTDRQRVFSNSNGSTQRPANWIVEMVAGGQVYVVHDADLPGQHGATWVGAERRPGWCPRFAEVASEVRNVKLPYQIADVHGKDLRDWISEGGTFEKLTNLAEQGEHFGEREAAEAKVLSIEEAEDDPHRLARVNLAQYSKEYNRKLVYWRGEWWRWKEGRYVRIEDRELRAKVNYSIHQEFVRCWKAGDQEQPVRQVRVSLVNNVIAAMESMCTLPGSVPMPCWLPDRSAPHYVTMANGILDLGAVFDRKPREECMRPHSPDWFSSFKLDYDFDPKAQAPKWYDYLDYVMEGDIDRINILQEWAGYLLTPHNDLQRFLVLEGEGGNGKTVFFAAMAAMLGEENVSHVSIENFHKPFDLGTTVGKAANISGDAGEIDSVAEGVLKQFTGGDTMYFDRKGISGVSMRPTAKLMAAWNSRPRIRDRSQGLWRRMLLIPFNRQVESSHRIKGMDSSQWWIDQGEASGILRWAIIGLHRLRTQGGFTESQVSKDAIAEFRQESNPASEFLRDHLEVSEIFSTPCGRVYELYEHWCRRTGHKPLGSSQFGKEVFRTFPAIKRNRSRNGNLLFWEYQGLKFSVDEIFGQETGFGF